ncbi:hypothetical protein GQ457_11G023050 [Hibiscus cannabinus]
MWAFKFMVLRTRVIGSNDFNLFIDHCNLLDLPLTGRKFTCISLKNMRSRLDRILVDENWFFSNPDITMLALPRSVSDHLPIIILKSGVDWGPMPFKFINTWLKQKRDICDLDNKSKEELKHHKDDLWDTLKANEDLWRQKSRMNWIKSGRLCRLWRPPKKLLGPIPCLGSDFAELMTFKFALEIFLTSNSFGKVTLVVESDFQVVLNWISSPLLHPWRWLETFADIVRLHKRINFVHFDYVLRDRNTMDDCLAKDGLKRCDCFQGIVVKVECIIFLQIGLGRFLMRHSPRIWQ